MKNLDPIPLVIMIVGLVIVASALATSNRKKYETIQLYEKVTSIKIEKINSNTFAVMYSANNYATKETYFLDGNGEFHRFVVE